MVLNQGQCDPPSQLEMCEDTFEGWTRGGGNGAAALWGGEMEPRDAAKDPTVHRTTLWHKMSSSTSGNRAVVKKRWLT